jgi:tellurium resistance protein TerZ
MGISLAKGQTVSLAKPSGPALTRVRMGLGWDAKTIEKRSFFGGVKQIQQDIDLDASAILCSQKKIVDTVYFGQLRSKDGSLTHTGDNRTGAGDGDDESIIVDLAHVDPSVDAIYFVVNSYSGQSFSQIDNAAVRVVDSNARDQELARYDLTGTGNHTAMIMAKLTRSGGGWNFTAIGQPGVGTRLDQVMNLVAAQL